MSLPVSSLDPHSPDYRASLSSMLLKLFDHWDLAKEDQVALLGLSPSSEERLVGYRTGEPLADNPDLLDRAGLLLGIHKSLRLMFPYNKDLAYRWVSMPNKRFDNKSPLDIMKERRFEGLLAVRRYLEFECQR